MCSAPLSQYFTDLETQIRSQAIQEEMERLKTEHPILDGYPTPDDLAALVKPGKDGWTDRDEVLRIFLGELKKSSLLFPLLNYMFWNSLTSIFASKRKAAPNPDELFARVQVDFYHTAVEYPLDRRPNKIDVNLVLDTRKKVTLWLEEESRRLASHEPFEHCHEDALRPVDLREPTVHPEEMEAFLLDIVYRKVITEHQRDLLLAVRVYRRRSVKEWAEARGVEYATARSWLQRAEKALATGFFRCSK